MSLSNECENEYFRQCKHVWLEAEAAKSNLGNKSENKCAHVNFGGKSKEAKYDFR